MPLRKGMSKEAMFHELGRGKTYARTKRKKGKRRADKQRVAIVLSQRRKHKGRKAHKRKSSR